MYKSIELIKIEFKRKRGNQNIIKINIDILVNQIKLILDNIKALNPNLEWDEKAAEIFVGVDFYKASDADKFKINLDNLDNNLSKFFGMSQGGGKSVGIVLSYKHTYNHTTIQPYIHTYNHTYIHTYIQEGRKEP